MDRAAGQLCDLTYSSRFWAPPPLSFHLQLFCLNVSQFFLLWSKNASRDFQERVREIDQEKREKKEEEKTNERHALLCWEI